MRMWNVKPSLMCTQHLLGEHLEMHMFVGSINNNKKIEGFIRNGLVETNYIKSRHDEIVAEFDRRGYDHKTLLEYNDQINRGKVDTQHSLKVLAERCPKCRELQERYYGKGKSTGHCS